MQIGSLWGLWIILAVAIFLTGVAGLVEYVQKRRKRHEDAEKMRERAAVFRTMLPKATSVSRVTSAFWQSIDKSKRQGSSEATNAAAPGASAAPCCASCVTAATACTTPVLRL